MTLDELDNEIALWKKSLGAAAQNLMDLHSLPTYQRLAGSNGVTKADLKGVTAKRVYPALASMGTLFQNFDDLQSIVDRAAVLRQNISPIFGSEQKLREIDNLLHGKSVRLATVPVPIGQRTLSTAVDNVELVTPGELMGAMAKSFTDARDVVLAVDGAWQKLGMELDAAMTELATFKAEGPQWNHNFPALATAESALETIRDRIENDPLGSLDEFDNSVAPVLQQARNALARLKSQREQITRGLSSAIQLMSQLADLHRQSLGIWQERRLKVICLTEPLAPQSDQTLATLREWLARLQEKFREGMVEPILVGLEKWNKAAAECVFQERASLNANEAPVKERQELRGRLEALKAKSRARGAAEHPDLTRIAKEATQLLFDRPTPIEKASTLVMEYEKVLRTLTSVDIGNANE